MKKAPISYTEHGIPYLTIKAPSEAAAWRRVLSMSDKGLVKGPGWYGWYDMKVTEIAPANAAGNRTYRCVLLAGRD